MCWSLSSYSMTHVYRGDNKDVDRLSNADLQRQYGIMHYKLIINHLIREEGEISFAIKMDPVLLVFLSLTNILMG